MVRMLGVDILEDAGFTVVEACNAAEALEALQARPGVRVLFTDVNMPGEMDGLSLAQRVHELRPDIRLLIASGQARPREADMPVGGDFIPKPWSVDDVVARIGAMLAT